MRFKNSWVWSLFYGSVLSLATAACNERASRIPDQLPYYTEASFTPQWISPTSPDTATVPRIPPFSLTDQTGQTITERDVSGKIYVANFFFTACRGICPQMIENMGTLQEVFKSDDDIVLLSHSVTPTRDSVPVLSAYADGKGIDAQRWHLLTGDREEIYRLGREHYWVEEDQGLLVEPDEFLHTENFVLVDGSRRIRGIYNGINRASVAQLIADIGVLKAE